jgi:hypothetical protein
MPKLVLNNNYSVAVDNFSVPKKIRRAFRGYFKFINKRDNKLVFTNGNITFTLWSNHRYRENYSCSVTIDKNNKYRTTKYDLNSSSVYVWISICPIEPNYLQSYSCSIATLENFRVLVDFCNKIKVKKNLKRFPALTKIFQDYYMTRYISEFL